MIVTLAVHTFDSTDRIGWRAENDIINLEFRIVMRDPRNPGWAASFRSNVTFIVLPSHVLPQISAWACPLGLRYYLWGPEESWARRPCCNTKVAACNRVTDNTIATRCHVAWEWNYRRGRRLRRCQLDMGVTMITQNRHVMSRGGILGLRCGEILLISSFNITLPGLGRVSAINVNKLTDFNAAVSNPGYVGTNLTPLSPLFPANGPMLNARGMYLHSYLLQIMIWTLVVNFCTMFW